MASGKNRGGKHKTKIYHKNWLVVAGDQMWCLQSSGTDKQREMKTEWGSSLNSGSEQSQTGEIVYVRAVTILGNTHFSLGIT